MENDELQKETKGREGGRDENKGGKKERKDGEARGKKRNKIECICEIYLRKEGALITGGSYEPTKQREGQRNHKTSWAELTST